MRPSADVDLQPAALRLGARIIARCALWACSVLCASSLCPGSAAADDALEIRRQQIANLSPTEQQDLLRRLERFNALPTEEQDRLRALQAAIDADEHAD